MTPIDFNPFAGDAIQKVVPATDSQKEIFSSCLIGGQDACLAYNEAMAVTFTGMLNRTAFHIAIEQLLIRNESLRSSFSEDGMQQIIYEAQHPVIIEKDISEEEEAQQKAALKALYNSEATTVFDLVNGPLIRFHLYTLSAEKQVLVINAHHIVCDGWSFGILLEEISSIYNALVNGKALPEKPLLFSDYALHVSAFAATEEHKQIQQYWIKEYEQDIPVFEITPDYARPPVRTYKARRDDYYLDKTLAEKIKKTGAKYGCSFVNTLLAAFEIVLYKYTGERNIVISLPTAGQAAAEMYQLIGHCVNSLPIRTQPDDRLPFATYLKNRKSKTLSDYDHQQFTLGALLQQLTIPRDPSRIPLVPVTFNVDIGMDMNVSFEGLEYEMNSIPRVCETFELFLNIADAQQGYELQWSYNTQLYKPATIRGLMDKYVYLLTQIVDNPEQTIAQLSLVDAKELIAQLNTWNDTYKASDADVSIVSVVNKAAAAHAAAVALTYAKEVLTYEEVLSKANRLAHYLIAQKIGKGDVVGIAMERSNDIVITILAILKAGAAYLPLDPQYAQERIAYMLQDAQAKLLITSDAYSKKFTSHGREINLQQLWEQVGNYPSDNPEVSIAATDTAYILYTSGSTGRPKGVMIGHASLVNYVSWAADYYLQEQKAVFPLYTSISFDLTVTSIFVPLITGNQIIIYEEDNAAALIERIITDKKANVIKLTPSHLKLIRSSDEIKNNLPAFHLKFIVGGEELETSVAQDVHNICKGNVTIYNEYGPTEATVGCMIHVYHPEEERASVPIGVPITNARIYLLDKNLQPVAQGVVGEMYIAGGCLAQGYYKNEKLTAERFIEDVIEPGKKMYKTGDSAVMLDNGKMLFKGRIDDQVKLRGYRIELGEIDYQLLQLQGVKDGVTIVREDTPGDQRLVSYVVLANGVAALPHQWRDTLQQQLPEYMVPASVVVMPLLPLTVNGKVDKQQLPKPVVTTSVEENTVTPLSDNERLLKKIWQEVLGMDNISVQSDFFAIGGHSMTAIKIMAAIEKQTGIKMPIVNLFTHPTIRQLATIMDKKGEVGNEKALLTIKASGTRPPIYLIHGGGLNILLYKPLADFIDEDQPLYGLQALGLNGDTTHLKNIETIAARYLQEVTAQNPDGPYIFVGYSLGGIIAYEMARQLLAQGKAVKGVGILDTNVSGRVPAANSIGSKLKRQFKKAAHFIKVFTSYPTETIAYQQLVLGAKVRKVISHNYIDEEIYDYSHTVVKAYNDAYYNYVMRPLDVKVDLFRVNKRIYFLDDWEYLGWRNFARKGVAIHIVPGDHKTFLFAPNNKVIAHCIQKVFNA